MSNKEPGYVYILTNPSFREDWVKIGKSSRPVDVRSKELDNTAVPLPFEIFATKKTTKYNEVENDEVRAAQKYLVVIATNVRTTSGSAYLWWLNGVNHGSSVAPTKIQSISQGTAFVWDMTQSGLASNNVGDPFSICQGATIFGLTSSIGTSTIKYIGFLSDISNIAEAVSVQALPITTPAPGYTYYDLSGKKVDTPLPNHIYITGGRKVLMK